MKGSSESSTSSKSHPTGSAVAKAARRIAAVYSVPDTRILILRVLVAGSIFTAAAICGTINYLTLSRNQKDFAVSQYDSISIQALNAMVGSFGRMNDGTLTMSKAYRYAFPNETSWPNVALGGFTDMAKDLARVSSIDNVLFAPVFEADKRNSFSDFMFEYWATEPDIDLTGTPVMALGGVWSTNPASDTVIYPDFDGVVTQYPTDHQGLFAVSFQMTFSEDITVNSMGSNVHTMPLFGQPVDAIYDCVANSANYTEARTSCSFFSNVVPLPVPSFTNPFPVTENVQAFIFQPIILPVGPDKTQAKLVGFLSGAMNWVTLLSNTVPAYVNGLDCVVTTDSASFTYAMVDGVPVFQGMVDAHDTKYSEYAQTIDLLQGSPISSFATYQVTFYPRRSFFKVYETDSPLVTTVGAICIILFCCFLFAWYDIAMSRESTRKEVILDTKRRFVRFISHEIRTPMNTVRLGLKLLEMEMEDVGKHIGEGSHEALIALLRESLDSWSQLTADILGNSDSAVDVLNDLLNYDKIESGTLRLEFATVDIWTLVKKTAAAFVMQAKQKSVHFRLIGDCWVEDVAGSYAGLFDSLRVVGDGTRIAQILRNLLSNALKFTPSEGTVTIEAEWEPQGLVDAEVTVPQDQAELVMHQRAGAIRISVTDSGAGLSAEQLAQICTEGMQFNANELQAGGGSGLGLFISKGLAEQHGGTLTVDSEGLGRGATFSLLLPLFKVHDNSALVFCAPAKVVVDCAVVPVGESASNDKAENIRELEAKFRPRRVIVVDDAVSNRKLLMRILKAKGYECDGAEDGQKAIELYTTLRKKGVVIDAILMDFEMPVMDGPTATKHIRELGCNCFIGGVTGNVMAQDVAHFRAQGANMVLAKPLNIEAFESAFQAFRAPPSLDIEEVSTAAYSTDTGSVDNV